MAKEGQDGQEKTEQPTGKRLQKSRNDGQVARSQEMNFVAGLFAALLYFSLSGGSMVTAIKMLVGRIFHRMQDLALTPLTVNAMMTDLVMSMLGIILPFMLLLLVVGVLSNVFQFGFLFTTKPMVPKFNKFNVVNGVMKLFGLRQIVEVIKSVLKLVSVAIVPVIVVKHEIGNIPLLMDMGIWSIMSYMGGVMLKILFFTSLVLLFIAIADFAYQKWKHRRDLMMSKQEVKEEFKQSEGDPKIKAQIRRLQIAMLRKAMLSEVPKADVVITNPTHFAVALKYDRLKMAAPTVVAKGARKIAEKIKIIAKENNVPIVENKPLAQSLYKLVDIGETIPEELYKAVAEVLAYVYNQKKQGRAAGF